MNKDKQVYRSKAHLQTKSVEIYMYLDSLRPYFDFCFLFLFDIFVCTCKVGKTYKPNVDSFLYMMQHLYTTRRFIYYRKSVLHLRKRMFHICLNRFAIIFGPPNIEMRNQDIYGQHFWR